MKPKSKKHLRTMRSARKYLSIEDRRTEEFWDELDEAMYNPKSTMDDIATLARKAGYSVSISLKPK